MFVISLAATVYTLAVVLLLRYCLKRFQFWQSHAAKMQASGYLTPPSSNLARHSWRFLSRLLAYLCVGPVKVTGRENLKVHGRKIFVANHQFPLDFALVTAATRTACPYMVKSSELKSGFFALLAAWTGAVPVNNSEEGGPRKAFDSSVKVLLRGKESGFMIFPQGALLEEIKLEDFKPGAARMQRVLFEKTEGEPVYIVPMHIRYLRDQVQKPFSHVFIGKLRGILGKVNYGGVVHIGTPIAFAETLSVEESTKRIYEAILAANMQ